MNYSIAEWLMLERCRRAHGAGYQRGNRSGCLKGTRESVLNKVEYWAENSEASIFWLHGLAGTGKTTIAQTVAERLFADGRLGASFFCFRGSDDRSDLQLIFPTLALQLAERHPKIRSLLIHLLQTNSDIMYQSLEAQMEKFLVGPLWSADISTVIVIDALDECRDEDISSVILPVLASSIQDIPKVKFFITSRPEAHIVNGFRGPLQNLTDVFILHEVEPDIINQDIRCFFEHELSKLAQHHGGKEDWPTDGQLDWLCRRAAGFFIHAVATVKVLGHRLDVPWDQLATLMESPDSEDTAREGEAKLKAHHCLDTLYISILRTSFEDNRADDNVIVRSVLSCVVLATDPLPSSAIATLMGLSDHRVRLVLELTRSLLVLSSDPNEPVQPFHKSFPDFMTDQNRCTDTRFYISPDCHLKLFTCCLEIIGKSLKNTPSLPDPGSIYKVAHLPRIETRSICGALRYACRSWHKHLVVTEDPTPEVLSVLFDFLEGKFVFWLVVLKALGDLPSGCRVMDATTRWLKKVRSSEQQLGHTFLSLTQSQIQPSTQVNDLLDIAARRSDLVGHLAVISNLYGILGMP